MYKHTFTGEWITDAEFCNLSPRNVFHRQIEPVNLPPDTHQNRHILFRKRFSCRKPQKALLYFSADDYGKVYINGKFVIQGPAPSYPINYGYLCVDITDYIQDGENLIAVHTLYQGLINRVWVSGDHRHGFICDIVCDGVTVCSSDESFLTHIHTGYTVLSVVGNETQFMERYDSRAREVGFELPDFDDSYWENAKVYKNADWKLAPQKTSPLVFEKISPASVTHDGDKIICDFGAMFVGNFIAAVSGERGSLIKLRFGQELNPDGSVRHKLRANCVYEEEWILSGKCDTLDPFDYKSFRYVELHMPPNAEIKEAYLLARHYPFELKAKPKYNDTDLIKIWDLCVRSQKYGVQEVPHDCMEREKGFYVGDGCYTTLTHAVLTGKTDLMEKLIDDGFRSSFINRGLMTCLDCSKMQEIAEYSLMLVSLLLWHYRLTGDKEYLAGRYPLAVDVLDFYREAYEDEGLLRNIDKWCVVEWPKNFRDGYVADITENQICKRSHVSICAYYLEAINSANEMARILGLPPYRDRTPLINAFYKAFYNKEKHLFRDGEGTEHISYIGNVFPFAFRLCPDEECEKNIISMICERGISYTSLFCTFLVLMGLVRRGRFDLLETQLKNPSAWLRMIREGATATFEAWGKDLKWNTSLFHLAFSYGALFLADIDIEKLLG